MVGHYATWLIVRYVNYLYNCISDRIILIAARCCFSHVLSYGANIQRMVVVLHGIVIGRMVHHVEIICTVIWYFLLEFDCNNNIFGRWCHDGACVRFDRHILVPIPGGWGPWQR